MSKKLVTLGLALLLLSSAVPAAAQDFTGELDASWLERLQDLGQDLLLMVLGRSEGSEDEGDPSALPDFDPNGATGLTTQPDPPGGEILALPDFDPNG